MTIAVQLQVDGVDLSDDAICEVIAVHDLDVGLWAEVDGIVTVTVYHDDDSNVVADVVNFARRVEHRVPGARVKRVHRDFVTASDISHRTGFSRESVRKWADQSSKRGFPAPIASVGGDSRPSKLWLWSEVATWLTATYGLAVDDDSPSEAVVAHIEACLAKVPDYTSTQWVAVQRTEEFADLYNKMRDQMRDRLIKKPVRLRHVSVSSSSELPIEGMRFAPVC